MLVLIMLSLNVWVNCFPCTKHDIVVLIDESGSMDTDEYYNYEVAFIIDLTNDLPVRSDSYHVGIVRYGGTVSVVHPLNGDGEALFTALDTIDKDGGGTYAYLAFDEAAAMLDGSIVDRVIIFLTDGVVNSPEVTKAKSQALKDDGVEVYSLCLGLDCDMIFMADVSSGAGYYFQKNFADVWDLMPIFTESCLGFGSCGDSLLCHCVENYYGTTCNFTECYGILSNESHVCGGNGKCQFETHLCFCDDNYYGEECQVVTCDGYLSNETEEVCHGHGDCVSAENCSCNSSEYHGQYCHKWECFGVLNVDEPVCSDHGNCVEIDTCTCDEHYYSTICNITTCKERWNNDSSSVLEVCNFRGWCSEYNNCTCFSSVREPVYPLCDCPDEYYGDECLITTCDDILSNSSDPSLCNSHGTCDPDSQICDCPSLNYTGDFCENWECFGNGNNDDNVCSGHGTCLDVDRCYCVDYTKYDGEDCEYWTCDGIGVTDVDIVCSGHGWCVDVDFCHCWSGYWSLEEGGGCSEWNCGEFYKDDIDVCNRRGTCIASHLCRCKNKYEGLLCETWSCGFDKDSPLTCSGKGKCIEPEICDCNSGYYGKMCQNSAIIVSVVVSSVIVVSFGVCVLLCCFVCCCCCIGLCVASVIIWLCVSGAKRYSDVKRFSELKDFEILLKEQETEEDMSIANLRINQSLFEIPFEEITVNKMLGEGGSNSIVFRAVWSGVEVAFKCFKTRLVCSDQDVFDEFEREVKVFASVSHPNIVRFYGATIKPPRVGIVMEFCINGDLVQFLTKYTEENSPNMLPLKEKIRMCSEVVQAMIYLHSRSIIHRDLKLENVLLDDKETCKLMDFGLSTIVERMSQAKTTRIGTNLYMAPEIFNENLYTEKCDVFSFGVFIYILMTQIWEPYGEETGDVHIEVKVSSDPNFRPPLRMFVALIPSSLDWLKELMIECWSHSEENRPIFDEIGEIFKVQSEKMKSLKSSLNYVQEEKEKVRREEREIRNMVKELAILQMTYSEINKDKDKEEEEEGERDNIRTNLIPEEVEADTTFHFPRHKLEELQTTLETQKREEEEEERILERKRKIEEERRKQEKLEEMKRREKVIIQPKQRRRIPSRKAPVIPSSIISKMRQTSKKASPIPSSRTRPNEKEKTHSTKIPPPIPSTSSRTKPNKSPPIPSSENRLSSKIPPPVPSSRTRSNSKKPPPIPSSPKMTRNVKEQSLRMSVSSQNVGNNQGEEEFIEEYYYEESPGTGYYGEDGYYYEEEKGGEGEEYYEYFDEVSNDSQENQIGTKRKKKAPPPPKSVKKRN